MKRFLDILREKIVFFDGAMGSNIQSLNLSPDDFGGERYQNCNEYLVITKPSAIEKIHEEFLTVGCDVIETNSFGGSSIVLSEFSLGEQAYYLNYEAARLAKKIANDFSTNNHPRFVAGSLGPTTKLPSLGHITFKEMETAYYVQAKGLIEGGADLLCVETCQDILQAKAALAGILSYFSDANIKVPIIVSLTIDASGKMLLGTEISAALTTLEPYDIDVIGINCATGPMEMSESIRYLCANSPMPVSVMPNAGSAENIDGRPVYKLKPDEFVNYLSHFVKDLGVSIVGGCCGTTKEHINKLVEKLGSLEPVPRHWEFTPSCSSFYINVPFHVEPAPVLIGERTNANGSKLFRELLAKEDWDGMVTMAKEQIKEGAHLLDVSTAYTGRKEAEDFSELLFRFNTQITAPLMIDSTDPIAIEEALQRIGGKAIVNSVNLEGGEERLSKILTLCKKYGAAVVALTIDENGMAKTIEQKTQIARRIHSLATKKYHMKESDLIFDTLTFTLGSGDEELRDAAVNTLKSIRLIKEEFPRVHTCLGISNISYGLLPQSRIALNSVFLHYAIEYGLDLAIVNASKILPLYKIPEIERELCRKLIFNKRTVQYDPLKTFIDYYDRKKGDQRKTVTDNIPIYERLRNRIIEGNKFNLEKDLDEGLKNYSPLEIINNILLSGMKTVGELFGNRQMQLPFVLQSAEVMKAALNYLEKFMLKSKFTPKGTLVIATVKGDVHDIGKNLVDIILTNNGYRIINLGVQCSIDEMLNAALKHNADAIGMSGLLVKSTHVMKENLEILNERGIRIPVILGGAALTSRYVQEVLQNIYHGELFYAKDAFDGLNHIEQIIKKKKTNTVSSIEQSNELSKAKISKKIEQKDSVQTTDIPIPPFWGTKVVENIPLDIIFQYINEAALIRGRWRIGRGKKNEKEYQQFLNEIVYPEIVELKTKTIKSNLIEPKVVYGYFPCQSENNDLIIYTPNSKRKEYLRFTFPRQTKGKRLCISDFFASESSGIMDVVAFQLVTVGKKVNEYAEQLFKSNNYKEYLYFYGFCAETTEALAEYWHKNIRHELNIHQQDSDKIEKLFSQHYRGCRYSIGYPACPNLEDQLKIFELLMPERIGISLTEGYQLNPELSTSAIIAHHPKAKLFNIT